MGKLRSLGVGLHFEDRVGLGIVGAKEGKRGEAQAEEEEKNRSFVEVAKAKAGRIGDAVWIQLGGQSFEKQGEAIRALSCGKVGNRVWPVSGFRLFKDLGEKAMEFERGSVLFVSGRRLFSCRI